MIQFCLKSLNGNMQIIWGGPWVRSLPLQAIWMRLFVSIKVCYGEGACRYDSSSALFALFYFEIVMLPFHMETMGKIKRKKGREKKNCALYKNFLDVFNLFFLWQKWIIWIYVNLSIFFIIFVVLTKTLIQTMLNK